MSTNAPTMLAFIQRVADGDFLKLGVAAIEARAILRAVKGD